MRMESWLDFEARKEMLQIPYKKIRELEETHG